MFQSTRPRGARHGGGHHIRHVLSFNPRAREGRDEGRAKKWVANYRFNPRAREGRDGLTWFLWVLRMGFNPRAREGRDRCAA